MTVREASSILYVPDPLGSDFKSVLVSRAWRNVLLHTVSKFGDFKDNPFCQLIGSTKTYIEALRN